MLACASHKDNPIEKSRACNGFVVKCLHQLPLELFTKSNRESILKAWKPDPLDSSDKGLSLLSYKMAALDSAVLSLKIKMWQRPLLYDVSAYLVSLVIQLS